MSEADNESFPEIRESVRRLCGEFPGTYWQAKDRDRAYPVEFVETLTRAGFLSVLILSHVATHALKLPKSF